MNPVPTLFRVFLALTVLSLALLLSCSTSTDSGEEPDPLNKWPTKPTLDTDNGAPALNANNVPIDIELKWKSTDPDGDPLVFDVYLGTDKSPPIAATDIAEMSYSPSPPLEYSEKYYWKVIAKDGHNHKATSEIWNFTTIDAPQNPFIELSTGTLNFGANLTELQFTIKNTGTGTLDWSIIIPPDVKWLANAPAFGNTFDETDTITVTVDRDSLDNGSYTADLVIQSHFGQAEDIVRVEMEVVRGDYYGELSIVYDHSVDTLQWTFKDSIVAGFILSVDSGQVSGTFDAVQFVTIVPDSGCSYDSLVQETFSGLVLGTESVDSMAFGFFPVDMPLSFKLVCGGTEITVPLYELHILLHLPNLNVLIEKLDGAVANDTSAISIPNLPPMDYVYNVTIHKL